MNQLVISETDNCIRVTVSKTEYAIVASELEYLEEQGSLMIDGTRLTFDSTTRKAFERVFSNDPAASNRFKKIIETLSLVMWTTAVVEKPVDMPMLDGYTYTAATLESMERKAGIVVTEKPAPVVKLFSNIKSNRREIELAAKAQKNLTAIIDRIERGFGYKSRIDSEVITSIWFVFPNQYAQLDSIITQHTDFSHDVVLESALPALRNLLTEITVENVVL